MKKSILFLIIIVAGLSLTSCLGENETKFSGTPLSYIDRSESGVVFARTWDGFSLPITSPEIKLQEPGSFVFISYSWTETLNTITSEGIYNVTVNDISDPIEQTVLIPADAPVLENELPLFFKATDDKNYPLYLGTAYNYHWLCFYGYKKGDGVKKELKFYHNLEEGTDNEVIIDVRLEETAGTVTKDQEDILTAVNLKRINDYYSEDLSSSGARKNIRVFFRYYREKTDGTLELYKLPQSLDMTIIKE
jgi:hypothetical protein